jgi:hypothetical protein
MSHQMHNASALSGLEHRARLAAVFGERLFAQDVAAAGYGDHCERTMSLRRRCYGNDLRTGTRNRLVEIGKSLRYTAVFGTPPSALGVRTYEPHDVEACGS